MSFMFLSAFDDLPEGGALGVDLAVNAESVALIALRAGSQVKVFHNVCPHAGRRLEAAPGCFIVDTGMVVCAAHGACFTIPSGTCIAGPCRGESLREVPCEIRGTEVWVDPA